MREGCMMVSVQNLGVSEGVFFLSPELVEVMKSFVGAPRVKIARNRRKSGSPPPFITKEEKKKARQMREQQ